MQLFFDASVLAWRIALRGSAVRSTVMAVRMQRAEIIRFLVFEVNFHQAIELQDQIRNMLGGLFSTFQEAEQQVENQSTLARSDRFSFSRLTSNQRIKQVIYALEGEFFSTISDIKALISTLNELYNRMKELAPEAIQHLEEIALNVLDFQGQIGQCVANFEGMKKKYASEWKVGKGAAIGLAVGGAAVLGTPLIVGVVGFGSAGVAGGSLAASVQGIAYGGSTSGLFSICQSVGAAGLSTVTTTVVPAASCALGGLVSKFSGAREEKEETRLAIPEMHLVC